MAWWDDMIARQNPFSQFPQLPWSGILGRAGGLLPPPPSPFPQFPPWQDTVLGRPPDRGGFLGGDQYSFQPVPGFLPNEPLPPARPYGPTDTGLMPRGGGLIPLPHPVLGGLPPGPGGGSQPPYLYPPNPLAGIGAGVAGRLPLAGVGAGVASRLPRPMPRGRPAGPAH